MQVKDWTELKDGDLFRVHGTASENTRYYLGLSYNEGTVYLKKGKNFALFGNENYLFGASDPQALVQRYPGDYRLKGHKQAVEVFDPKEDFVKLLPGLTAKVGGATGCDPEIFVVRGVAKTSLLPAFKFLKDQASQKKMYEGDSYVSAYAYRDGFAAESFVKAGSCHGHLIDRIREGLARVLEAARNFDRTAKLTIKNTFRIPKVTMSSATDEEVAFGCNPSLNAYGDFVEQPQDPREFNYRFAGGHVHLAVFPDKNTNKTSEEEVIRMVKGCDLIAGIPAVAIFASVDSPARRQFYGRAGEFRMPSYGFEYRTLSNGWLAHPKVAHLMLNLVRCGAKVGKAGYTAENFGMSEEDVKDIINYCDVKKARKFCADNEETLNTLLKGDGAWNPSKAFNHITQGGVEDLFPDYEDVEKNWKLGRPWSTHSDSTTQVWAHATPRA